MRTLARFEGRLFAEAGILFLVVEADAAAGVARVSFRVDGQTQVMELPLAEIARRLSSGGELKLDNLNGPVAAKRIVRKPDGWFFAAREGFMGPYDSGQAAQRELARHVLAMQSQTVAH